MPTLDFEFSQQSFTILTPTKGEHFVDVPTKCTKLDFHECVGGTYPGMEEEITSMCVENDLNDKFKSSSELVSFIIDFLSDKNWANFKESETMHNFAFFPPGLDNKQSAITFTIDTSINTKELGSKSIISVYSSLGKVDMKVFKDFFAKLYIPQTKNEILNFITFIEENWENLGKSHDEVLLKQVIENFNNCSDIDQNSPKVDFVKNQLNLLNVHPNQRRYSCSILLHSFSIYIKGPKAY